MIRKKNRKLERGEEYFLFLSVCKLFYTELYIKDIFLF